MKIRLSATVPTMLVLAIAIATSPTVRAQDIQFRDGRFLETLGSVTIQRADDASSDEVVRNMPFLPGDRVWTDDGGRAEIIFADGEVLWIAERSKIDSLGRGGREQDERLGLRLFSGAFGVRVRSGGPGFEVQAAGGTITTTGASAFRVDARAGETLLSVSEGEVIANLGGERMTVREGERVRYANGRAEGPYLYQRAANDSFDRWCLDRSGELNRMARENDRLPGELGSYGDELDRNGAWVDDEAEGSVYVPRVSADWAPYTYGRWVYTLYGWTWVDDQPWGFVTSHYGRWGYSSRIGWHWLPRLGFSGAWVSWSTPIGPQWSNTIGWCALGFNDRPISSFAYSASRSGVRGEMHPSSSGRGWSFANRVDLGRGNIARRRVAVPADEAARAVVWNASSAPDREFHEARRGGDSRPIGRSGGARDGAARVYVRPSPGDSNPALRYDPTTTIPTPESRRGPTIGQDGFKEDQDRRDRSRRDDANPSVSPSGVSPSAGTGSVSGSAGDHQAGRSAPAARTGSRDEAGGQRQDATHSNDAARPGNDPLLNRFFRSITRPNPSEGDSSARSDDSARRRDPQQTPAQRESQPRDPQASQPRNHDDSSTRENNPRERSRPQQPPQARPTPNENHDRERSRSSSSDDDRGRARPSGGETSQPRSSSPPPQRTAPASGSSAPSGSSDAKHRPPHKN